MDLYTSVSVRPHSMHHRDTIHVLFGQALNLKRFKSSNIGEQTWLTRRLWWHTTTLRPWIPAIPIWIEISNSL